MTGSPGVEVLKFLEPDEVRRVAAEFGTPVFVYDEATMERNADYMASLPSAFGLTIRYSLKACPSQAIVCTFDRLDLSFDASSTWEARRAIRAGVLPEKILLTAQQAQFSDGLAELIESGVQFDAGSLGQLDRYGRVLGGADVSIRINPGFGSGLVRRLTAGGPDSSFGIWHETMSEAMEIIRRYDLRVRRLHTHIGSGHHWDVLVRAVQLLLRFAHVMPDVTVLNLGGGYRVKALLSDPEYDHSEWATAVASLLREFAAETGRQLHLEIEPGTYLMANAGSIITRVIDIASTGSQANGAGHTFLKIDGGLTEIIRPSYYGAVHPLVSVPASGPERDTIEAYCVAGHCCIAGDVLTTKAGDVEQLDPVQMRGTEEGDYVVIERGGGYCSSMAMKNFNSYPEAPEVLRRRDHSFELIRARQTLDQMIGNERMPADLHQETSGIGTGDSATAAATSGGASAGEPSVLGDEALDGAQNVPLAPVRGLDLRRNLPSDIFPKRPLRFTAKFWFAMALIAACYVAIAASLSWAATVAAIVILGLMYAHLVELQHECLHEHAFNSRRLNRMYGFACGLFMLSSYSYYKYEHLRHHASLGKPNNREFFNYRFRYLDSVSGFFRAAFHLGRYVDVMRDMACAATGRPIPQVSRERDRKRIFVEYRLFIIAIAGAIAFTAATGSVFFALAWLLPVLLISEPTHFFIELPEHFGLNTQTDANVLANTRTIEASGFARWFTNFNNLHTAHHYHQGVPVVNVRKLNELIKEKCAEVEPSYWTFYKKVVNGEIRYEDPDVETCMTR